VWSWESDPAEARVMYVGTPDKAVSRSEDSGGQGRRLAVPPHPDGRCVMGFPTRMIRLAIAPTHPDALDAGVAVGGLGRSRDGGVPGTEGHASLLALAAEERDPQPHSPRRAREGRLDTHVLALSAAQPGTVWLAHRLGLWRREDQGKRWCAMEIGRFSPLPDARDGPVFPHDSTTLLGALSMVAGRDVGALYRSADLGATWTRFAHDVSSNSTLRLIAARAPTPARVDCAVRRGQVLGTEDGGKSWPTDLLPAEGVSALACV
jgi:photosystem II stability/assembly factor-like uncharacterized protein